LNDLVKYVDLLLLINTSPENRFGRNDVEISGDASDVLYGQFGTLDDVVYKFMKLYIL
jgi:hypothetical protein